MKTADLDFAYPPELVATEPLRPSRVLFSEVGLAPAEISLAGLLEKIPAGDVLVINDTKVLPVRVWSVKGDEVLFVRRHSDLSWDVLFLARDYKLNDEIEFPGGIWARLSAKGLPQRLIFDRELSSSFFAKFGEPALPPYIQAARGDRHAREQDKIWYQTAWAENAGSSAAPTASLHFSLEDLRKLREKGVSIAPLTLHVGLGTFLPIKSDDLSKHEMHAEEVFLSNESLQLVRSANHVWALGTTCTRALEAWAQGHLSESEQGFHGETKLFITPGFEFQIVDRLLTNFHQPRSTLLALVMAFAGEERVREAYRFAIENRFRLFSYGDLSAWM
jgi:S-adenosylmethionine:tRNA ribosyltransferase-isomerase